MQKTYLDTHGTAFGKSLISLQNRKQTNLKKYGVEFPSQQETLKQQTSIKKLTVAYETLLKKCESEHMVPEFSLQDYVGVHHAYTFKCAVCGSIRTISDLVHDKGTLATNGVPLCLTCNPPLIGTSKWENEVTEYLHSLNVPFLKRDTQIIAPYEVDFYFPSKNFAIELHGNYWHSELGGNKLSKYHQNKAILAKKNSIVLCQIFQDEWLTKPELLKNYIRANLGLWDTHLGARKCTVLQIPNKEASIFLNENHFQGSIGASISWGLFYNQKLLGVMTFGKPRFSKKYEWELLRFAVKSGYKIPGSFSKLFSTAIKTLQPKNMITYADARFFTGASYISVGFVLKELSSPNYYYMAISDYLTRYSRYSFQKHKLSTILPSFDDTKSEWENMKNNKFDRIWDCGNYVYTWEP